MWAELLRRVGALAYGKPPPRVPPGVRRADKAAGAFPAFVPDENPLEASANVAERNLAAMTIVDPDCYGYLLLTVHKQSVGPRADLRLQSAFEPSWWPAMRATLCRVIKAGDETY